MLGMKKHIQRSSAFKVFCATSIITTVCGVFSLANAKMNATNREFVEVRKYDSLVVYSPNYSRIDLVTGTMPSKDDVRVVFVCEAAFTGKLLESFEHSNVAGHHVCDGVFYEGYDCAPNNGVFTWSKTGGWKFFDCDHEGSEVPLRAVAKQDGMGFCQNLLFWGGQRQKGCFKPDARNQYRALCELDGKLCVIDCARTLCFKSFMDGLQSLGVKNAIYLDMGPGWNYSWLRNSDGSVKELFNVPGKYTTNWITFYR